MDSIQQLIQQARQQDCSDIHLTPGHPPYFRKVGNLICSQQPAEASETEEKILALLNDQQKQAVAAGGTLISAMSQTPAGSASMFIASAENLPVQSACSMRRFLRLIHCNCLLF